MIKKFNQIVIELFNRGLINNYLTILFCWNKKYYSKFDILFYYEYSKQTRTSKIAFNYWSDTGFQDFMNLYQKCTAKPYSLLVINSTIALDNPLRFKKNIKTNHDSWWYD